MGVTSKHLATFILGAAAGIALNKYLQTEEGEKLMETLKTKGNELKDEAEAAIENSKPGQAKKLMKSCKT